MTTTLFETTRVHVEKAMSLVSGDQDFMPLMVVRAHDGHLVVCGLGMGDTAESHDQVAWTMSAVCTLYRATEVAFTSVAWYVQRSDGKPLEARPSECADRREVAMISMIGDDESKDSLHVATVIRENNMCGVGMWEEALIPGPGESRHAGRFPDAIRTGMTIGKSVPPDLSAYMDERIAANEECPLIQMMVDNLQKVHQMREKGVQN